MSDQIFTFTYSDPVDQRLDKFLVSCLPDYSRSRLQGLIKDGFVKINGELAAKGGRNIETGDQVEIRIPPAVPSDLIPENIPLQIIYENKHLMVINKPAGMVVHPAAGHRNRHACAGSLGSCA